MIPPELFVISVYWAWPSTSRPRSFESKDCRSSLARGPSTSSSPMCETSKTPASVRTAMCSGITPSYCTGISHPANGTIRAPSATWRSKRGVRRSVCIRRLMLKEAAPVPPPIGGAGTAGPGHRGLLLSSSPRGQPRTFHKSLGTKPVALRVAQKRRNFQDVVRDVEAFVSSGLRLFGGELLGLGGLRRAPPARPVGAEPGCDHRHAHLVVERLVDDCAEDDVRILVRRPGDHLGRFVHLEEPDLAAAGDVEQDPGGAFDRRFEQRRRHGCLCRLGGAVLAGGRPDAHQR